MDIAEAIDLINNVTYKPLTKLRADYDRIDRQSLLISITMRLPDATQLGPTHHIIKVAMSKMVPVYEIEYHTRESLILWLKDMLVDAELHELDEWFRVDGKVVTEQHSDEQRAEHAKQTAHQSPTTRREASNADNAIPERTPYRSGEPWCDGHALRTDRRHDTT